MNVARGGTAAIRQRLIETMEHLHRRAIARKAAG
jgi:hypothetical protein